MQNTSTGGQAVLTTVTVVILLLIGRDVRMLDRPNAPFSFREAQSWSCILYATSPLMTVCPEVPQNQVKAADPG